MVRGPTGDGKRTASWIGRWARRGARMPDAWRYAAAREGRAGPASKPRPGLVEERRVVALEAGGEVGRLRRCGPQMF
jgi:hypothetical protein